MKDCPSKLDLTSTEDLVEELNSRFDHSVFFAIKEETDDDYETFYRWDGLDIMCIGLALKAVERIQQDTGEM